MRIGEPWLAVAAMSSITVLLRAVPLLMRKSLLRTPWMLRLNRELPLCVMVILVAHSLGGSGASAPLLAEIAALGIVAGSYLHWRNALLSVVIGLAALSLLERSHMFWV
ncbi:AzlD domain-containing protein [Paraburkholderia sp. BCC1876]|uniref:AzlD domain-containing protein n=1 Tax=Paraburkholderia sp. BCC1876 TaxID=2676303 RepID=UPI001591C280|nr:AzlD domain-containing protein [Paraburkholderia sp. BCC1876]